MGLLITGQRYSICTKVTEKLKLCAHDLGTLLLDVNLPSHAHHIPSALACEDRPWGINCCFLIGYCVSQHVVGHTAFRYYKRG